MQVNFTREQEAELLEAALFSGKAAEQLVQELAVHFLEDQACFREGVRRGIAAADRNDFVDTTLLWADVDEIPEV